MTSPEALSITHALSALLKRANVDPCDVSKASADAIIGIWRRDGAFSRGRERHQYQDSLSWWIQQATGLVGSVADPDAVFIAMTALEVVISQKADGATLRQRSAVPLPPAVIYAVKLCGMMGSVEHRRAKP